MAIMMIAGERYDMPVWLKGRLLAQTVYEIAPDVLAVESGSEVGKSYRVYHANGKSTRCTCPAVGECAHRIAANLWLADQQAERQNELDEAHAVAAAVLGKFADDLPVHVDDELSRQQAERARKLAAQAAYRELYPDDFGYYGDVA